MATNRNIAEISYNEIANENIPFKWPFMCLCLLINLSGEKGPC